MKKEGIKGLRGSGVKVKRIALSDSIIILRVNPEPRTPAPLSFLPLTPEPLNPCISFL